MRNFLIEDLQEPLGYTERDVFDVAEAAGKGADGVGRVDCEGTFKDVEADGAGIGEEYARRVAS